MGQRKVPWPHQCLARAAKRRADDRKDPICDIETGKERNDHFARRRPINRLDEESENRNEDDDDDAWYNLLGDEFGRAMLGEIAPDAELRAITLLIDIDHRDHDNGGEDRAKPGNAAALG